jgi:hypothetical protein
MVSWLKRGVRQGGIVELVEESQAVSEWPDFILRAPRADDKALEAVFESLGRVSVQRLVSVPHPFGLPPQDRLAATRWLSRQVLARQRGRDLTVLLTLIALGLAAALVVLSITPMLWPANRAGISDAVRTSAASMTGARD